MKKPVNLKNVAKNRKIDFSSKKPFVNSTFINKKEGHKMHAFQMPEMKCKSRS